MQDFDIEADYQHQGLVYNGMEETEKLLSRRNTLKQRMLNCNGIKETETISENKNDSGLRIIDNSKWKFCESYPPKFLIPRNVSNSSLLEICKFRSKGRIPIFCYSYPNHTSNFQ